jgi:hypothetical protein
MAAGERSGDEELVMETVDVDADSVDAGMNVEDVVDVERVAVTLGDYIARSMIQRSIFSDPLTESLRVTNSVTTTVLGATYRASSDVLIIHAHIQLTLGVGNTESCWTTVVGAA